ncbi:hypothetical protein BV898_07214 [Hypsibius exemplaris]|uniref:Uncharacterized protein n=1 Tax=Hypsibius exemplaris TaxID=2072580 RepID=A0A1W0WUE8_HYPEX|nr:hypothetical protein BV898_07214 [Hypsibius exemplaris]
MGKQIGLELNLSKCEAFVLAGNAANWENAKATIQHFDPTIKFPTKKYLSFFGAALLPEGIPIVIDDNNQTPHQPVKYPTGPSRALHPEQLPQCAEGDVHLAVRSGVEQTG